MIKSIQKVKIQWLIFILIFILSIFLRLYKLDTIPPSLNWDEVAIAWNAYSIWEVHLDEYGTKWPIVFKSFGDYKAPGMIYLTAPFVGILGLSPFVIRMPSALAGIASVIVIYLLAGEIGIRLKLGKNKLLLFKILCMFLLAISPWHLFYSRAAYEANVALFFSLIGIWLSFISLRKPFLWFFPGVFYVLSLYTYHSPKIFLPLFISMFVIFNFKECVKGIWKYKWINFIAIIVLLISLKPLVEISLWGKGAERLGTSILVDNNNQLVPLSIPLIKQIISNLIIHLSPNFWLAGNDHNYRLSLKKLRLNADD